MRKSCQYKPNNIPDNTSGNIVEIIDNVGLQGAKGDSGLTPYIGENQHWWIGTEDTGVQAEADVGASPYNTKDDFPSTGKTSCLYIDKSEGSIYRWDPDTSTYLQLSTVDSEALIKWAENYFGNETKPGYTLIKDTVTETVEKESVPIIASALKQEDATDNSKTLEGTVSDYHLKEKDDNYSGISLTKINTDDLSELDEVILTANNEA